MAKESTIGASVAVGIIFTVIVVGLLSFFTIQYYTSKKPSNSNAEQIFVDACAEESGYKSYCKCTWDDLRVDHSVGEIAKMGIEYDKTGEVPEVMVDSAMKCLDLVEA